MPGGLDETTTDPAPRTDPSATHDLPPLTPRLGEDVVASFREAFRHASIGMALVSLDGRYLMVNDELCRLVGRDCDDLLGRTTIEITHPDDRAAASWTYPRLSVAGEVHRLEKRFVRPDGTVAMVIRLTRVVCDHAGEPSFMFAQYVDVTERNARFAGLAELGRRALDGVRSDQLVTEARALVAGTLGLDDDAAAAALGATPDVFDELTPEDQDFIRSVGNVLDATTARSRAESESRRMAVHDALTGLANRTLLSQRLEEALGGMAPGR